MRTVTTIFPIGVFPVRLSLRKKHTLFTGHPELQTIIVIWTETAFQSKPVIATKQTAK
jgi:hypothetical protein